MIWLCAISAGFTIESFTLSASEAMSTPYTGIPFSIPGLIEAEFFDKGGQKLAYYDDNPRDKGRVSVPTTDPVGAGVAINFDRGRNQSACFRTHRLDAIGPAGITGVMLLVLYSLENIPQQQSRHYYCYSHAFRVRTSRVTCYCRIHTVNWDQRGLSAAT